MLNDAPGHCDQGLLGRREVYTPYNSYKASGPEMKYEGLLKPGHLSPQYTHYELHHM